MYMYKLKVSAESCVLWQAYTESVVTLLTLIRIYLHAAWVYTRSGIYVSVYTLFSWFNIPFTCDSHTPHLRTLTRCIFSLSIHISVSWISTGKIASVNPPPPPFTQPIIFTLPGISVTRDLTTGCAFIVYPVNSSPWDSLWMCLLQETHSTQPVQFDK